MSLTVTVYLFIIMCCVKECMCFPNGSVAVSCGNMMPIHPPFSPAPTTSPPFTLTTSSATYTPGGLINVTVEVLKNSSTEFQGFLLQARSRQGNALMWPVGKFTNIDTGVFTPLHCKNMENSSVSQATGVKRKRVQATWEAPGNSNYGDIYFSASVVQDYTTFWVEVNSTSLKQETSGNSASGVFSSSALLFINLLSLTAYC